MKLNYLKNIIKEEVSKLERKGKSSNISEKELRREVDTIARDMGIDGIQKNILWDWIWDYIKSKIPSNSPDPQV